MMYQANILDPLQATLPPNVWEHPDSPEPTLRPIHAHWITKHIYATLEQGGYTKPHQWLHLYLTGSLCTFQYSDSSDCDVSLFIDSSSLPEWSRAEMIGLMIEGTEGVVLPGTPYQLQAYVVAKGIHPTDTFKQGLRAGYSIDDHHWISPPDHHLAHDVSAQENGFYVWALEQADKMERLLRYEPDKAVGFWHQIHKRRMRDQVAGKGDFSESNILYKFLNKRGLLPAIAQTSGEHIAAWTQPADVNFTTNPPQNPFTPGPSPFANTQQWQINMANKSGEELQQWMLQRFPDTAFQVQQGQGGWGGEPEPSTALHLYATPHHQMQSIMHAYGQDHPEEEYFAIMPHGQESYLWANPSGASARPVTSRATFGPEVGEPRFVGS